MKVALRIAVMLAVCGCMAAAQTQTYGQVRNGQINLTTTTNGVPVTTTGNYNPYSGQVNTVTMAPFGNPAPVVTPTYIPVPTYTPAYNSTAPVVAPPPVRTGSVYQPWGTR